MDIFDFALKMELESEKYYREQAKITQFTDLKALLEILADAEARHYKIVEDLRLHQKISLPEDEALAKARNIFASYEKDADALRKAISIDKIKEEQIDIYRLALIKEKESVELYEKMLAQTHNSNEKLVLEKLIKEEQAHEDAMDEIIGLLNKVNDWVEAAEFNQTEPY